MPALITHNLFAHDVAGSLSQILTTSEEHEAFYLGAQGPDPFFCHYRGTVSHLHSCHAFARAMHQTRMSEAFDVLRANISCIKQEDQGLGRAFVVGLLSHYVLDSTAHPFVFAEEYALQAQDPTLEKSGTEVHAVIEADLDSWMLWQKRHEDASTGEASLSALAHTERIAHVAGALMSQVASQVFNLDVNPVQYAGSLRDYEHIYATIEPKGNLTELAYTTVEESFRTYSMLKALVHPQITQDVCTSANTAHHAWVDPSSKQESHEDFMEVYERACARFPAISKIFLDDGDTKDITHHINYDGIRLQDDEIHHL